MEINPIEVQKHLGGMSYPASKDDVVSRAEENDAPQDVLDALRGMSREQFDGQDDVMEALG